MQKKSNELINILLLLFVILILLITQPETNE